MGIDQTPTNMGLGETAQKIGFFPTKWRPGIMINPQIVQLLKDPNLACEKKHSKFVYPKHTSSQPGFATAQILSFA